MLNPFRSYSGLKKVLVDHKTAKLSDADIVGGLINLQQLQNSLSAEVFDGVCNKYQAYLKLTHAQMYDYDSLVQRIIHIACDFSVYTINTCIFNVPDYGIQLMLPSAISQYLNKAKEVYIFIHKLMDDIKRDLEPPFDNYKISPLVLYSCAIQYYSAVASIIINGNSDASMNSVRAYAKKETHESSKEMIIWHAIRIYEKTVNDYAYEKFPMPEIEKSANAAIGFLERYEIIMRSPLSVEQKCKALGKAFFESIGVEISEEDFDMRSRLHMKWTNDFVEYIVKYN